MSFLVNGEVLSPGLVKRKRVQSVNKEPSMTKQDFVAESDINNIVKHFVKTGNLPISARMPKYGDYTSPYSFQESMQIVIDAQAQFDTLDAHVRKRFSNDPAEFLAFMADPKNEAEAIRLGLAEKVEYVPTDTEKLSNSIKELSNHLKGSDNPESKKSK